jgi:hypothetical protein
MSYSSAELKLVASGGPSGQIWVYEGTDDAATVAGTGYISDSGSRGMRVGDMLVIRQFTSAAKTALTAQSIYSMTAVTDAASAASQVSGATSNLVGSGTATPDANLDVGDGYLIGSIYVETDQTPDEPYVCTNNATGAAVWQSMANDVVLQATSPTLTSAGQTLGRLVAPFAGRITAFRAIVSTAATGATDKLVRLVVSGNTVGSGTLTLVDGDAAGTKYAATPTTDNAIAAGNQITIQSGAQPCATGVFNFFVVCRKMIGSGV